MGDVGRWRSSGGRCVFHEDTSRGISFPNTTLAAWQQLSSNLSIFLLALTRAVQALYHEVICSMPNFMTVLPRLSTQPCNIDELPMRLPSPTWICDQLALITLSTDIPNPHTDPSQQCYTISHIDPNTLCHSTITLASSFLTHRPH